MDSLLTLKSVELLKDYIKDKHFYKVTYRNNDYEISYFLTAGIKIYTSSLPIFSDVETLNDYFEPLEYK